MRLRFLQRIIVSLTIICSGLLLSGESYAQPGIDTLHSIGSVQDLGGPGADTGVDLLFKARYPVTNTIQDFAALCSPGARGERGELRVTTPVSLDHVHAALPLTGNNTLSVGCSGIAAVGPEASRLGLLVGAVGDNAVYFCDMSELSSSIGSLQNGGLVGSSYDLLSNRCGPSILTASSANTIRMGESFLVMDHPSYAAGNGYLAVVAQVSFGLGLTGPSSRLSVFDFSSGQPNHLYDYSPRNPDYSLSRPWLPQQLPGGLFGASMAYLGNLDGDANQTIEIAVGAPRVEHYGVIGAKGEVYIVSLRPTSPPANQQGGDFFTAVNPSIEGDELDGYFGEKIAVTFDPLTNLPILYVSAPSAGSFMESGISQLGGLGRQSVPDTGKIFSYTVDTNGMVSDNRSFSPSQETYADLHGAYADSVSLAGAFSARDASGAVTVGYQAYVPMRVEESRSLIVVDKRSTNYHSYYPLGAMIPTLLRPGTSLPEYTVVHTLRSYLKGDLNTNSSPSRVGTRMSRVTGTQTEGEYYIGVSDFGDLSTSSSVASVVSYEPIKFPSSAALAVPIGGWHQDLALVKPPCRGRIPDAVGPARLQLKGFQPEAGTTAHRPTLRVVHGQGSGTQIQTSVIFLVGLNLTGVTVPIHGNGCSVDFMPDFALLTRGVTAPIQTNTDYEYDGIRQLLGDWWPNLSSFNLNLGLNLLITALVLDPATVPQGVNPATCGATCYGGNARWSTSDTYMVTLKAS